jgi:hypothetical protein
VVVVIHAMFSRAWVKLAGESLFRSNQAIIERGLEDFAVDACEVSPHPQIYQTAMSRTAVRKPGI